MCIPFFRPTRITRSLIAKSFQGGWVMVSVLEGAGGGPYRPIAPHVYPYHSRFPASSTTGYWLWRILRGNDETRRRGFHVAEKCANVESPSLLLLLLLRFREFDFEVIQLSSFAKLATTSSASSSPSSSSVVVVMCCGFVLLSEPILWERILARYYTGFFVLGRRELDPLQAWVSLCRARMGWACLCRRRAWRGLRFCKVTWSRQILAPLPCWRRSLCRQRRHRGPPGVRGVWRWWITGRERSSSLRSAKAGQWRLRISRRWGGLPSWESVWGGVIRWIWSSWVEVLDNPNAWFMVSLDVSLFEECSSLSFDS